MMHSITVIQEREEHLFISSQQPPGLFEPAPTNGQSHAWLAASPLPLALIGRAETKRTKKS